MFNVTSALRRAFSVGRAPAVVHVLTRVVLCCLGCVARVVCAGTTLVGGAVGLTCCCDFPPGNLAALTIVIELSLTLGS